MEGILVYNFYKGSDPEDFYKVWFRDPEASFYLNDRTTWKSIVNGFFHTEKFTVGGPKCLIKW